MLGLDCVKKGEKLWALRDIQKTDRKLYFRKKFYFWQITPAFFESITLLTIVLTGEDCEYLFRSAIYFFLDGTFRSCPLQFAQLYILDADHESHRMITAYIEFCLYFSQVKMKQLVTLC